MSGRPRSQHCCNERHSRRRTAAFTWPPFGALPERHSASLQSPPEGVCPPMAEKRACRCLVLPQKRNGDYTSIHDKFCQEKKSTRGARRSAKKDNSTVFLSALCASRQGSCDTQNHPSICCLWPATKPPPSQKIEFVFSASPETSGRESWELPLRRPDV